MENRDKKKDELNKKQQNNTDTKKIEDMNETTNNADKKNIEDMNETTNNTYKKNIEDMNETTNNANKKNVEDITERKKTGKKLKLSNRAYNIIRYVALVCAAAVLIYASYSLTDSYLNYKEDEAKYAEINKMFTQKTENKKTKTKKNKSEYSSSLTTWVWNYKAMLQYNDEARGYIKLDGTRIQYPIVEHSDNDFYLKKGSDKISNGAGAIFLDYRTAGLDGKMCILYGHNMLDGSMFKGLMSFRESKFAKAHQIFDIYVGYKHYLYYVFSTFTAKDNNEDVYKYGFDDDVAFQKWINLVAGKSSQKFDYGIPGVDDKIIMCSTCVDDYGNRQIVCMYRGEEVVD